MGTNDVIYRRAYEGPKILCKSGPCPPSHKWLDVWCAPA